MNWKININQTSSKVCLTLRNKSIFNVFALNFDIHLFSVVQFLMQVELESESEKRDC